MRASPLVCLLLVACSFPDVTLLGAGGEGATTVSAGGSSTLSTGGSTGGASDGGATTTSTGGAGGACDTDADDDGHVSIACGGDDCDDTDNRAYPGQTQGFGTPRNGGGSGDEDYDFNCSGTNTLFLTTMSSCGVCVVAGTWCKEAVECGVEVVIYSCETLGISCTAISEPNPCI